MGISIYAWNLGIEAFTVIGFHVMKIAHGGAAGEDEARLMIGKKIEAATTLQIKALTSGLCVTPARATAYTLAHYRRKLRAKRRRLSKL